MTDSFGLYDDTDPETLLSLADLARLGALLLFLLVAACLARACAEEPATASQDCDECYIARAR